MVLMELVRMNMMLLLGVVGMRVVLRVVWREHSLLLLNCPVSVGIGCTCMVRIG